MTPTIYRQERADRVRPGEHISDPEVHAGAPLLVAEVRLLAASPFGVHLFCYPPGRTEGQRIGLRLAADDPVIVLPDPSEEEGVVEHLTEWIAAHNHGADDKVWMIYPGVIGVGRPGRVWRVDLASEAAKEAACSPLAPSEPAADAPAGWICGCPPNSAHVAPCDLANVEVDF